MKHFLIVCFKLYMSKLSMVSLMEALEAGY